MPNQQASKNMTRFEEGDLAFDFGPKWQVIKLDEHRYYREGLGRQIEQRFIEKEAKKW
jgi:hypothetical protein